MSIASPRAQPDKPGAKIVLPSDLGERVVVETPWTFDLGEGLYRLDNVPWWAAWLSAEDVVRCEPGEDGRPVAIEVVEAGGQRTARVLFSPLSRPEAQEDVLAGLRAAGAFYEGTGGDRTGFYAVSLPPSVDVADVLDAGPLEWQLPGEPAFLARCHRALLTDNFTVRHPGGELMVELDEGHWERLRAEPAGPGRRRVASIALFAYGVHPGDLVEAAERPGEFPVLRRVLEPSGRWSFHVAAGEGETVDALAAECERLGGEVGRHPWEESRLFAVAVDGDDAARAMQAHLEKREREGVLNYETGW